MSLLPGFVSCIAPLFPWLAPCAIPLQRDRRYAAWLRTLYFRMVRVGQPNESPRI
jgi:hypothetical protein